MLGFIRNTQLMLMPVFPMYVATGTGWYQMVTTRTRTHIADLLGHVVIGNGGWF
jgi:hypothetical protein